MIDYEALNRKYPLPEGLTFCECNGNEGSLAAREVKPGKKDNFRWNYMWYYPAGAPNHDLYTPCSVWWQTRDGQEENVAEVSSVEEAAAFMSARLILLGIKE